MSRRGKPRRRTGARTPESLLSFAPGLDLGRTGPFEIAGLDGRVHARFSGGAFSAGQTLSESVLPSAASLIAAWVVLDRSDERFRQLAAHVPEAFWMTDLRRAWSVASSSCSTSPSRSSRACASPGWRRCCAGAIPSAACERAA